MRSGLSFEGLKFWLAAACAPAFAGYAVSAGAMEKSGAAADSYQAEYSLPAEDLAEDSAEDEEDVFHPQEAESAAEIDYSKIKEYSIWLLGQVNSGKIQPGKELLYVSNLLASHYLISEEAAPFAGSRAFSSNEAQLAQAVWGMIDSASNATGFFIKTETESGPAQYFVTNFHVMRSKWANSGVFSLKLFLYQENGRMEIALIRRAFVSALHDLALLEMSEDIPGRALEIRKDPVSPHESVFSIGYPNRRLRKINQKLPFLGRPGLRLTEEAAALWFEIEKSPGLQGISGAPVFDQKGKAVAVYVGGTSERAIASASQNILKILAGEAGTDCSQFIDIKSCEEREIQNLERLAERGGQEAQIRLAFALKQDEDMEGFKQWLRAAAKENNKDAQRILANYYRYSYDSAFIGESAAAAIGQAFYWYLRYHLNFLWEARANGGAEDWEALMLSP